MMRPTFARHQASDAARGDLGQRARNVADRALATIRRRTLQGDELAALLYAQQRLGSHAYFIARLGQSHTVPLSAFPHTMFAADPIGGRRVLDGYLDACWTHRRPDDNSPDRRAHHLDRFHDRLRKVETGQRKEPPVLTVRRRDGRLLIVDGNHRAAIALALHQPATVGIASTRNWLHATASLAATYYATPSRPPAMSIFDGSQEVVVGRDRRTRQRFDMLRPEDITGRHVVDLACDVGATAFLAADSGASAVTAIDSDPNRIIAALRLNAYFASCVSFVVQEDPGAYDWPAADTLLWFPRNSSAVLPAGLHTAVRRSGARVVYLESQHPCTIEDIQTALPDEMVESVEACGPVRATGRHGRPRVLHRWLVRR